MINHKDGIQWHNELYNLEWCTQSENMLDAIAKDLAPRSYGEDNGFSELSNDQYREICRLTEAGYFPNQINSMMDAGIDITNIAQKIRSGNAALDIAKEYNF